MIDYNVPHGKLNRGMAVLDAFKASAGDGELAEEQIHKARILGWCIEFVRCDAATYVFIPRGFYTTSIPCSYKHTFW